MDNIQFEFHNKHYKIASSYYGDLCDLDIINNILLLIPFTLIKIGNNMYEFSQKEKNIFKLLHIKVNNHIIINCTEKCIKVTNLQFLAENGITDFFK